MLAKIEERYEVLRQKLARIGYISHGSVYRRPAGQSGARFTWSSKVKNKTVSLALTEEQADWLEQAIVEHRELNRSSPKCIGSPARSCDSASTTRSAANR